MENQYKNFTLDVTPQGFAIFTVNRPEVRNAMSSECWMELGSFIDWAEDAEEIKAIIITGTGDKAFVAGADIKAMNGATRKRPMAVKDVFKSVINHVESCVKPVIAAVNGVAFGGGFELAMACDIRLVCPKSKFALPEVNLGLIPGLGGTQRLARLVGMGRAKEIVLLGRAVEAEEAVQIGLAYRCVDQDKLVEEAIQLAEIITTKAPLAIAMCKQLITLSMSTDQNVGQLVESYGFTVAQQSEDKAEGVKAFVEKRKPNFVGR